MKQWLARIGQIARNPIVRPIEVWAVRAAVAYIGVKLGVQFVK